MQLVASSDRRGLSALNSTLTDVLFPDTKVFHRVIKLLAFDDSSVGDIRMQVKCIKFGQGQEYRPDGVVNAMQNSRAILAALAVGNPPEVVLNRSQTQGLHILGGRSSIVQWLRL